MNDGGECREYKLAERDDTGGFIFFPTLPFPATILPDFLGQGRTSYDHRYWRCRHDRQQYYQSP